MLVFSSIDNGKLALSDGFGDGISLYFLSGGKLVIFAEAEEMDDGFREDDFAYFEVDLLVFEDLNLLDPATDAHVLEDVDCDVDDC